MLPSFPRFLLLFRFRVSSSMQTEEWVYTTKVYDNHSRACAYLCIPLTGQDNLQEKVDTLQDKVDTVQHKVVNLEDKLDTFQNTTEASTRKNHHEVVELLHNTSFSLDGKI